MGSDDQLFSRYINNSATDTAVSGKEHAEDRAHSADAGTSATLKFLEEAQAKELPKATETPLDWAYENVAKPLVNQVAIKPYNAFATGVNFVASPFHLALPKAEGPQIQHAEPLSPEWVAQNVSGALGMGVTFYGASKITGAVMGRAAGSIENEAIKTFLQNRSTAMITGATLYEGLRDPEKGETRLGNVSGALVAFGAFEAGGAMSRDLTGAKLWTARMGTGSIGALSGGTVSSLVSRGELPTGQEMLTTALVGGVMNVALGGLTDRFDRSSKVSADIETTPLKLGLDPRIAAEGRGTVAADVAMDTGPAQLRLRPATNGAGTTDGAVRSTERVEPIRLSDASNGVTAVLKPIATEKMSIPLGVAEAGPFTSVEDAMMRGVKFTRPSMDIYKHPNHPSTRIAINENLANYPRITPEQAAAVVDGLPDARLVKRLIVADGVHPDEPYARQLAGDTTGEYRVFGKSTTEGDITLYRPAAGATTETTALHEWSHLHKLADGKASAAFDKVRSLEEYSTPQNGLASGFEEPWPVLSETLLGADPMIAATTAMANPIRSSIIAKSLGNMLNTLPESQRGSNYDRYMSMVKLINETVLPHAKKALQGFATDESPDVRIRAREISEYLNSRN